MPVKNALRFEVVYISDNSGQVEKRLYELIKQPSGERLLQSRTYV